MQSKKFVHLLVPVLIVLFAGFGFTNGGGAFPPAPSADYVPGELIVGFEPGVSVDSVITDTSIRTTVLAGGDSVLAHFDASTDIEALARRIAAMDGVAYAEPNYILSLHVAPNDPLYPDKWDLNNTGDPALCDGSQCPTADADIDWEEAYTEFASTITGSAVIAVVDTGIDFGHPDLNDKIVSGYDYLDGDSNPADDNGHGTHVAGIAAAETNNGIGTAGVAWSDNIKVMPLRVCNSDGCPTTAINNAIYHAADNGADVINLSLGGPTGSTSTRNAIDYAWGQGLVIVASSGNDGNNNSISYPAAFSNAIAVGSTDFDDNRAGYSNAGSALDISAPGGEMSVLHDPEGIMSTLPTYYADINSFGYYQDYDTLQGTSMAAPQVSGLAALLFAQGYSSNADVRSQIESTADDLGSAGWDKYFGNGRINVYAALGGDPGGGEEPPVDPVITLDASAMGSWYRYTMLYWSGATTSSVDVYMNGSYLGTTTNDGSARHNRGYFYSGTDTYIVCNAGSTTECSNEVTVTH
ncbi:MAG: S8 family serine peptidase [Chloroflexi bacterium]|nr:S8 family serine peptidase [Chloroflexota bacterium]